MKVVNSLEKRERGARERESNNRQTTTVIAKQNAVMVYVCFSEILGHTCPLIRFCKTNSLEYWRQFSPKYFSQDKSICILITGLLKEVNIDGNKI